MKEYEIDKKSWHFKFINYFECWDKQLYPEYKMPHNFCAYWNLFLKHLLNLIVAAGLVLSILFLGIFFIYLSFIGVGTIWAIIFYGGTTAIVWVAWNPKKDGIFYMKYRSWKDKFCTKLKYKE